MYLNACRKIYVGNVSVDTITSMMEVCRKISELRHDWKDKNGRQVVDMPEELFTKIIALARNLIDCARGWPIQLCSTYYTALSSSITNLTMASREYTTQSLIGLDTKTSQLEALQHVREGATLHHKELTEEDACREKKLKTMIRAS